MKIKHCVSIYTCKEETVENMTDKQMEVILNLVADKFAACKDMDEVKQVFAEVVEVTKKFKEDHE